MTSATRSVAVVATRLPTTDRRALSQAWFSALHGTAPAAPPPTPSALPERERSGTVPRPAASVPPFATAGAGGARVAPVVAQRSTAPGPVDAERRAPASDLTRRIERAIVRQSVVRPLGVAAIAVKAADGRIHLLVRTEGGSTRIIALCAPHLRERVDRALAAARFSLAASGAQPPAEVSP